MNVRKSILMHCTYCSNLPNVTQRSCCMALPAYGMCVSITRRFCVCGIQIAKVNVTEVKRLFHSRKWLCTEFSVDNNQCSTIFIRTLMMQ